MKKVILIAFSFLLFASSTNAQIGIRFDDYPVTKIYTGKNARVVINNENKLFRTRLKEAVKNEKVNFAGHYILSQIGCGAGCLINTIIDAKTGKTFDIPFSICCTLDFDYPEQTRDLQSTNFRVDSKLLIFIGIKNETSSYGAYFYKFENDKLIFVKFQKLNLKKESN